MSKVQCCHGCGITPLNGNERCMAGIPNICTVCDIGLCWLFDDNTNCGHTDDWYYHYLNPSIPLEDRIRERAYYLALNTGETDPNVNWALAAKFKTRHA